jgi:putative transposase
VNGEEAERIKRDAFGIGDRRKHHTRTATPPRGHSKAPNTHHRLHRFRFYPTEEQAEQLGRTFGVPAGGSTTRGWPSGPGRGSSTG